MESALRGGAFFLSLKEVIWNVKNHHFSWLPDSLALESMMDCSGTMMAKKNIIKAILGCPRKLVKGQ